MPSLTSVKGSKPIIPNPTPATALARKRADSTTPIIEQDNPFLDAAVPIDYHPKTAYTDETDASPLAKRTKLTHLPIQSESARKLTRWADLEEQLIASTYKAAEPVVAPPAQPTTYEYNQRPPKAKELIESLASYGLPSKIHRAPYYSDENDVPEQPMRYAGRVYHIKGGTGVASLDHWESADHEAPTSRLVTAPITNGWEYAGVPPSPRVVKQWLDSAPSQDGVRRILDPRRSQVRVYARV